MLIPVLKTVLRKYTVQFLKKSQERFNLAADIKHAGGNNFCNRDQHLRP